MNFQAAVIKEQGITFAVVVVKKSVIDNKSQAEDMIRGFAPIFPGIPVVLMAQNHRGTSHFFGRQDLSKFLAKVPIECIPWKEYSYSERRVK